MAKIYDLPAPSTGQRLTYLVMSDIHSLKCDPVACEKIFQAFQFVPIRERRIILLGDILDIPFLFQKDPVFKKAMRAKDWDYFLEEMQKEVVWYDEFHQRIRKLVLDDSHIKYALGNHEERLTRSYFFDHIPHSLLHNFVIEEALDAEKRGLQIIDYNDWFKITTNKSPILYLTHGQYCGQNPIKKHYIDSVGGGGAVIFGHTHEAGMKSFKNLEHTIIGYNNPCLCGIDAETQPKYLEGKSNNWSQGAIFATITPDHHFVNILLVKDGELALPTGEVF